PDAVERVVQLLGEARPDLDAVPEEPPEVLHPLEVRDGDAAGVREDVGKNDDTSLREDRVSGDRGRAVRALDDDLRENTRGVPAGHLTRGGGEDAPLAGKLEQAGVRDRPGAGIPREPARVARPLSDRRNVEPGRVIDPAGNVGDGDDGRAAARELERRDTPNVAEALDDAALPLERHAQPL